MRKIIFLWLGMLGVCAHADLIGELRQSAIEAREEAVGVTLREPSSTFAFGPFASLYSDGAFLNLEPKLGVLASRVVFMPQLSVAIPF